MQDNNSSFRERQDVTFRNIQPAPIMKREKKMAAVLVAIGRRRPSDAI